MRSINLFPLLLAFLWIPAQAVDEIQPFVGDFTGTYASDDGGVHKNRDLSVHIKSISDGFNVIWKTTTYKKNKPKTKEYNIDFVETDRPHIYKAAQKKNVFGGREPLDPMKGEPYGWARIDGPKLTVYALIITEDGDYELQTYDRILESNGNLRLRFSRIRDGETLKTIEADLSRQ